MGADVLDCIHGIDLMWPCVVCEELAGQIAREYDMQVSGTFPQLNRKDGVTVGKGKGGSKKGGKGRGC
jgi:hypothetical protein